MLFGCKADVALISKALNNDVFDDEAKAIGSWARFLSPKQKLSKQEEASTVIFAW